MKAIDLLKLFVRGELNHERSGICDSDSVILRGWYGFFGAEHYFGSIKPGETLFYLYIDADEVLPEMPISDVVLKSKDGESGVYIWKLEN